MNSYDEKENVHKLIYAVHDDLSFEFGDPFVADSEITCLRMVSSQVDKELRDFEKGVINFDPTPMHTTKSLYFIAFYDKYFNIIQNTDPKKICKLCDSINYYQKLLTEFN